MYPLWSISDVMLTRNRKSVAERDPRIHGPEVRLHAAEPVRGALRSLRLDDRGGAHPQSGTLSALKALIVRLGGLREGRKAIILISEGFTNTLPPQVHGSDRDLQWPGRAATSHGRARSDRARARLRRRAWSRRNFSCRRDLLGDLRRVYELANRYNTAIYAVDPRGLAPFEFDLSTQARPPSA